MAATHRALGIGFFALAIVTGACSSSSNSGGGFLACEQSSDSDTDDDCDGHAGKPRKLDCDDDTQTNEAIAAGCEREKAGDNDVCCPSTVSGTPKASSSSDGGSSSTKLECRQKAESDTDSDCTSKAGKPRKLDCDNAAQTAAAEAAGCVRTSPTDSDVCCPLTVSGTIAP